MLREHYPGCICAEARDGEECIELVNSASYDIVILDVNLPQTDTLSLVEYISSNFKNTKVLIFTMYSSSQYAFSYYKKGAMGFLNKESDRKEIIDAVKIMLHGGVYMDKHFSETLALFLKFPEKKSRFGVLSEREFATAQELAKGLDVSQIAALFKAEESSIRSYKARLFKKLGVKSMVDFLDMFNKHNGIF